MQSQIFEQTTAITSTAAVVFDSEAYGIDVANSVYMGVSILNTGSANAQLQVDIKTHPSSAWFTHTAMGATGGFAATNTANLSTSFYRNSPGLTDAIAPANSQTFFAVNLKFVYAIRILSRMATGSSGNSIRIRGNVKIPKDLNYEELPVQQITLGAAGGSTIPTFTDVSAHAFFSIHFVASGTAVFANMSANTVPNQPSATSGYLLGIRYYPDDAYYFFDVINTTSAIDGNKLSMVIVKGVLTSSVRSIPLQIFTEAAYEIGFLWNIPAGAFIDYYISLNG
jgi:hypothetical protein